MCFCALIDAQLGEFAAGRNDWQAAKCSASAPVCFSCSSNGSDGCNQNQREWTKILNEENRNSGTDSIPAFLLSLLDFYL
jgi:hypothetical protein